MAYKLVRTASVAMKKTIHQKIQQRMKYDCPIPFPEPTPPPSIASLSHPAPPPESPPDLQVATNSSGDHPAPPPGVPPVEPPAPPPGSPAKLKLGAGKQYYAPSIRLDLRSLA